jgi:glutamine synthetase adenylyltransferase
MSLMTTQTLDGRVYEIDTRLRPSGEAGVLVTSPQHLLAWIDSQGLNGGSRLVH